MLLQAWAGAPEKNCERLFGFLPVKDGGGMGEGLGFNLE